VISWFQNLLSNSTCAATTRCYAFDHDALLRHFDKDPGALAAVTAAFGASLVEKLSGVRAHTQHTLAVHSAREGTHTLAVHSAREDVVGGGKISS
jgi:hypothetical protein